MDEAMRELLAAAVRSAHRYPPGDPRYRVTVPCVLVLALDAHLAELEARVAELEAALARATGEPPR
jgi:hypothetical protein